MPPAKASSVPYERYMTHGKEPKTRHWLVFTGFVEQRTLLILKLYEDIKIDAEKGSTLFEEVFSLALIM